MVKKGDFIEVSYTGKIKGTGEIFDLTDEKLAKEKKIWNKNAFYGPIPMIIGAGHMLPALEEAFIKMKVGQKKTVMVEGAKAFGERKKERLQVIPEKLFRSQKVDPKVGMMVNVGQMIGKVQSVSGGRITVDFNHPLAGKTLEYEIKIEKQVEKLEEQVLGLIRYHLKTSKDFGIKVKKDAVEVSLPKGMLVEPRGMKQVADDALAHLKIKTIKFTYTFEK